MIELSNIQMAISGPYVLDRANFARVRAATGLRLEIADIYRGVVHVQLATSTYETDWDSIVEESYTFLPIDPVLYGNRYNKSVWNQLIRSGDYVFCDGAHPGLIKCRANNMP